MAEPFIYVPVLRWKAAEQSAFANLTARVRNRICPLIEICPPGFPTGIGNEFKTSGLLRAIAHSIVDSCRGQQIFIDFIHLDRFRPNLKCLHGLEPLQYLFECLAEDRLLFPDQMPQCIPVTGIQRPQASRRTAIAIAREHRRLCIRLTRRDIQERSLGQMKCFNHSETFGPLD